MKVYTLNSFAQNNETGFFDEYYDNHGVFIMKHFAEQFSHQHDFSYFKNVLESGNAGLAKFYIHIDDDSFKLSGITISRNKGENE